MNIINSAIANKISNLIRDAIKCKQVSYKIHEMNYCNGRFENFSDEWINNKDIRGSFEVISGDRVYFIFLVDWYTYDRYTDNRYTLVIHVKGIKGALFGSYKYKNLQEIDTHNYLYWRYKPTKRDGKNEERRRLFENEYSDIVANIKLPQSSNDIQEFIDELLKIVDIRINVEKSINSMD